MITPVERGCKSRKRILCKKARSASALPAPSLLPASLQSQPRFLHLAQPVHRLIQQPVHIASAEMHPPADDAAGNALQNPLGSPRPEAPRRADAPPVAGYPEAARPAPFAARRCPSARRRFPAPRIPRGCVPRPVRSARAWDGCPPRMAESFRYSILPTARVMARWISSTRLSLSRREMGRSYDSYKVVQFSFSSGIRFPFRSPSRHSAWPRPARRGHFFSRRKTLSKQSIWDFQRPEPV